ncbi:GNAT family N-acetyltransferase [Mycolicibacterium sp. P9-64]|uniref:GNAT family N-acetyltransferase n=1 Tax=Mycolicibacterium sp. P9-64 TaxID=2024612 RepID=UPI0011EC739D|nr:GNAT family N-acetyltransferase [Mycolicibacterium sp. P9-64]KAA0077458.1 GNAT family N-acetyltransferase [Mycolicibacterium sp. P9-64]
MIGAGAEAARQRVTDQTQFVIPIAGGLACFAGDGSPLNKVVGLGFGGVPDQAALDEIEIAYSARGTATQIELTHLADPEIATTLVDRGYSLVGFENVLGRALDVDTERVSPPGVTIRESDDDEFDAWLDVVVDGFAHPDTQGVASHEDFPREAIESATRAMAAAGTTRYVALREGEIAGSASVRLTDDVALFTGAATAPAHRRHGVQTALLSTRLADAADAGCTIAVVTTAPGSKSQQNVQGSGFHLLYTRAVLVK